MNLAIFHYLNGLAGQSAGLDQLIIFLAHWLPWFLVAIIVVYFFWRQTKPLAVYRLLIVGLVAIIPWAISELINKIYPRPRPGAALDHVRLLINRLTPDAFPSGHATFFFALATALWCLGYRKLAIAYFLAASIIGLARIAAGVHWPVDVLAGAALGLGGGYLLFYAWRKINRFYCLVDQHD